MNATKRCTKCEVVKSTDQFNRHRRRPDGLQDRCRDCRKADAKARYAANRERILAQIKEYRDANREAISARRKARNAVNPEPNRARAKRHQRTNRARAIEIYGGCCAECGLTDRLEFDHVNGDGAEHRQVEEAVPMYRRIARTGRLDDWQLQLLCESCHDAKTSDERRAARALGAY